MSTLFEILIQGVNDILNLINEMSCNNIQLHDSYEVNVSIESISTIITLRYQFVLTILRREKLKFFFTLISVFFIISFTFLLILC